MRSWAGYVGRGGRKLVPAMGEATPPEIVATHGKPTELSVHTRTSPSLEAEASRVSLPGAETLSSVISPLCPYRVPSKRHVRVHQTLMSPSSAPVIARSPATSHATQYAAPRWPSTTPRKPNLSVPKRSSAETVGITEAERDDHHRPASRCSSQLGSVVLSGAGSSLGTSVPGAACARLTSCLRSSSAYCCEACLSTGGAPSAAASRSTSCCSALAE
eukprot:scaffold270140_cov30-Tisochrysis_lutea.AAC.1